MTHPDDQLKNEIGTRFRRFREDHIKMTQIHLAAELGVDQSTITNIERGSSFPKIQYLVYLYKKHGLDPAWLFTGEGRMLRDYDTNGSDIPDEYKEMIKLMRLPPFRIIIMGKFAELKVMLRPEIESFFGKKPENGD